MGPREVFLSHSHQDRTFASRLSETLRRHGVPVWYSRDRIQGAQQWHDEIGRALNRCDWFAVLLTPSTVRSDWVKRELLFALQKKRSVGVPPTNPYCSDLKSRMSLSPSCNKA